MITPYKDIITNTVQVALKKPSALMLFKAGGFFDEIEDCILILHKREGNTPVKPAKLPGAYLRHSKHRHESRPCVK